MSEYIERNALIKKIQRDYGFSEEWAKELALSVPAADVAPVIHCKDCKYFEQDTENYGVCIRFNDTAIADDVVKATDFCSRAKRKGDDK